MIDKPSLGPALRHLQGAERAEIMTRTMDFNVQTLMGPDGKEVTVPANSLIAFTAVSWRELGEDTDVWEFRTLMQAEAGPVNALMYFHGTDLFTIRVMSRIG